MQPPPCGFVLKQLTSLAAYHVREAAVFARLRVETVITIKLPSLIRAAAYLSKDERRQNDYVSKWIT